MSSTTVAEFANELKKSTETLLEQLKSAGVAKSAATDSLTDADKQKLLGYLQASHGTATAERKKITLVKKSTSEIKQADASGRARTIQVEVRKKRTFVKRDEAPAVDEAAAAEAAAAHEAELQRREEEAKAQAEAFRRQEEELAEQRRRREEQDRLEREAAEARAREEAEKALAAAAAAAAAAPPAPAAKTARGKAKAAEAAPAVAPPPPP